jgi:mannose-6-phosphate isomerase
MINVFKLENTVKHYAWGSPDWIPRLLGTENSSHEPWAELWMGVHSEGPSKITLHGKTIPLSDMVELPFLFKFLAAGQPLSIQAHPSLDQAREGFERENRAGTALSVPERNYKDPNHKPEILCALTPFTAMAGFREINESENLLALIQGTEKLRAALRRGYGEFLSILFALGTEEWKALKSAVREAASANEGTVLALCREFAEIYPEDSGILSPLYLNVLTLKPFEALFVPAGMLHAYVYGFSVECMANSDNVLRGGLTPKHIDVEELFHILKFEPLKPEILTPEEIAPCCFRYTTPAREFTLYMLKGPKAELKEPGDLILAVFEGSVRLDTPENAVLRQGESVFIPKRSPGETLSFQGIPLRGSPGNSQKGMPGNFILFAVTAPEK